VAYNSDFSRPLGLLGVENVKVDLVFGVVNDGGDAGAELVFDSFEVFLVLGVVILSVPNGADFDGCALEVACAELAEVRCAFLVFSRVTLVSKVVFLSL
jgi:hypothetical protein